MQQILRISVTRTILLLVCSEMIAMHCDNSAKYLGIFLAEA